MVLGIVNAETHPRPLAAPCRRRLPPTRRSPRVSRATHLSRRDCAPMGSARQRSAEPGARGAARPQGPRRTARIRHAASLPSWSLAAVPKWSVQDGPDSPRLLGRYQAEPPQAARCCAGGLAPARAERAVDERRRQPAPGEDGALVRRGGDRFVALSLPLGGVARWRMRTTMPALEQIFDGHHRRRPLHVGVVAHRRAISGRHAHSAEA